MRGAGRGRPRSRLTFPVGPAAPAAPWPPPPPPSAAPSLRRFAFHLRIFHAGLAWRRAVCGPHKGRRVLHSSRWGPAGRGPRPGGAPACEAEGGAAWPARCRRGPLPGRAREFHLRKHALENTRRDNRPAARGPRERCGGSRGSRAPPDPPANPGGRGFSQTQTRLATENRAGGVEITVHGHTGRGWQHRQASERRSGFSVQHPRGAGRCPREGDVGATEPNSPALPWLAVQRGSQTGANKHLPESVSWW